jgi:hypothetical protein
MTRRSIADLTYTPPLTFPPPVDDPGHWLLELLADGPRPVPEIKRLAQNCGLPWWPIKEQRRGLQIVSEKITGPDAAKRRQWRLKK